MILRWLPAVAILVGLTTRTGAGLAPLIQPCLMVMMLAAFIRTRALAGWRPAGFLGHLLLFQIVAGIALFLLFFNWSRDAALTALLLALTPTAVSSAAVATGTNADVRLVTSTIAATSFVACITLPIVPMVAADGAISITTVLGPAKLVGVTVLIPYLAALMLLQISPSSRTMFESPIGNAIMRLLWTTVLWIAASKVGDWYVVLPGGTFFDNTWPLVFGISAFALFAAYGRFRYRAHSVEALICHAHKNTGLALLLILHSLPLSMAAAVLSYTLAQNVFFSMLPGRKTRGPRDTG